ncbi:class I SAM-dependent methyltransferase [Streptomyces sp. NPDC004111]|uniref:class I SAM-dependent methyltransferase n=1 Tax=Streptomyces sp. NPDC004111 TaxID=3364690 RepID=UPI0036A2002C
MPEPSSFLTAVRESYDTVAADYPERVPRPAELDPLSRAMLAAFAELVRNAGPRPVADLGCGPGLVTAHLAGLGVPAFGVDLSPQMLGLARRAHPNLWFTEGSMTALETGDGELGGILAWYSTHHTPPKWLPTVFAEFHTAKLEQEPGGRVTRPHACLLARRPEGA